MNHLEKKDYRALIDSARIVVRETGWVAVQAEHVWYEGVPPQHKDLYHTIMHAYDMACAHLTQLDPANAAEFIRSTYGPAFRQTEVTK